MNESKSLGRVAGRVQCWVFRAFVLVGKDKGGRENIIKRQVASSSSERFSKFKQKQNIRHTSTRIKPTRQITRELTEGC